jgi:gamma-glutamylcyclotransferase (GGCT)/AIG2-like uncharacterized protein YtfP
MARVFLYGTLKRGGVSHHLLAGQRLVGAARTRPEFRLHQLDGYPGMVRAPDGGRSIEGEIWEVDPACLARLDEWEGTAAGLFSRESVRLLPPDDKPGAEAYLYLRDVTGCGDLGTCYNRQGA